MWEYGVCVCRLRRRVCFKTLPRIKFFVVKVCVVRAVGARGCARCVCPFRVLGKFAGFGVGPWGHRLLTEGGCRGSAVLVLKVRLQTHAHHVLLLSRLTSNTRGAALRFQNAPSL